MSGISDDPDGVSRRTVLGGAIGLGTAAMMAPVRAAETSSTKASAMATKGAPPLNGLGYVCTYTSASLPAGSGHGEGIALLRFDPAAGTASVVKAFPGQSPSWLAFDPKGEHAYAVNELDTFDGKPGGGVTAYAVDRANGDLKSINAVGSGGTAPAHCSVHPSGKFLLVANYGNGRIAVLPIKPDGSLGEATDVKAPEGTTGPKKAAAAPEGSFAFSGHDASHGHMIEADPQGRFVLSNDLGLDRTFVWRLDLDSGTLKAADPASFATASEGAGARHFRFHPKLPILYNLYEEASQLTVYRYNPKTGATTLLQKTGTLPVGFKGSNFASALAISRDGRFLYAGNRLHNSIAVFAIAGDGQVKLLSTEWTRGDYPNQIALDPGGRLLFACNRRSDNVTVFKVDPRSGALAFTGQYLAIGSPNMVAFPA